MIAQELEEQIAEFLAGGSPPTLSPQAVQLLRTFLAKFAERLVALRAEEFENMANEAALVVHDLTRETSPRTSTSSSTSIP